MLTTDVDATATRAVRNHSGGGGESGIEAASFAA
jgi:hypothetical protein